MANITVKINSDETTNDTYGFLLLDRTIDPPAVQTMTEWMDGALKGTILRQSYDYRSLKLTFLSKENNIEQDVTQKISYLVSNLKECRLVFSDISDFTFHCYLDSVTEPQRVAQYRYKIECTLKFDWIEYSGDQGQPVTITPTKVNAQKINLTYINNWSTTINSYQDCFDDDEIYQTIAKESMYIDRQKIAAQANAAESWDEFFLGMGIPLNKYKPGTDNTLNGFIYMSEEFSAQAAQTIFNKQSDFKIYYNRFQKDGFADLPTNTVYPSIVWTTGEDNRYYFNLGVGQGWDIRDITLYVWGRYFYPITTGTYNGSMFGSGGTGYFTLGMQSPNAVVQADTVSTQRLFEVYETSSSGGQINIQTLESISATPLRQYGYKSSQDGPAAIPGFCDILYNGLTLDRIPIDSVILDGNLYIMNGKQGTGKYCEIARVQVYYKGELVKDLIPIAGNVKNGFVNNYDTGLYDVVEMSFIPWSNTSGSSGQQPNEIMPLPNGVPGPTPPAPPAPKYSVTVVSGTGSGEYEEGALVSITANSPAVGYQFKEWTVTQGTVSIVNTTAQTTSFTMPAMDVTVEATYEEVAVEPEILYYETASDIDDETSMGQNAKAWSTNGTDGEGPLGYGNMTAVYSIPNVTGTWSITPSRNYYDYGSGTDKWGRSYNTWGLNKDSGSNQVVTFTPSDGSDAVSQTFAIKSW